MGVEEIAQTDVVTAQKDSSVTDLLEMMADEDVGTVVIVDDDQPVGIVTDRSIALAFREDDVTDKRASDVMSEDLVTVSAEDGIFEMVETMRESAIRRVPVVDDGKLTGIVSLDDVFVLLSMEFDNAVEIIEQQSPRY